MNKNSNQTWEKIKLGNIATEIRDTYLPNPNEHLTYIGLEHIDQGTLHLNSTGMSSSTQSSKKVFRDNDILFGSLRPYFRKVVKPKFPGVCSTDITVIRSKGDCSQEFLFYFIANQELIDFATNVSYGTKMPRATWKVLSESEWLFPPCNTQYKITTILSAYDDMIENNNRRIKILEEMAKLIYKEWFVKFRFPGYEKAKMVKSELGMIPEGWEVRKLGETINLEYGKSLTAKNRKLGKIPVFGSSGFIGYHNAKLVDGPGIVVGRAGNAGSVHWVSEDFYPVDSTFYVVPKLGYLNLYFLYYLLKTQSLENLVSGVAVPGLNRHAVYMNEVIIPEKEILEEFKKYISPFFRTVNILSKQNNILRQTRDMLLPKLISGEIKV
jgi:type I restriction enzyme S subunit